MDKRIKIGLIYSRDENWIAGSYYIENLVHALNTLEDADKPLIRIYSKTQSEYDRIRDVTVYPFIEYELIHDSNTFLDRLVNKISFIVSGKHWIVRGMRRDVDVLFPYTPSYLFEKFKKKICWIPDFQELHYPHFFSSAELKKRKTVNNQIVSENLPIVFSSWDAYNDFTMQYPDSRNSTFVLPFAVTTPELGHVKIGELFSKFGIQKPYFICSNQFWAHKNHMLVLEAIKNLHEQGIRDFQVCFTGKTYDNRNPDYFKSLENFIEGNGLNDNIKFLGFIDRKEQLLLMKNSMAVIQPSLFEGWSTVVEDAKALNHPILVSDIPVHREQLTESKYFFCKDRSDELSKLMLNIFDNNVDTLSLDYASHIQEFGKKFLFIINEVV